MSVHHMEEHVQLSKLLEELSFNNIGHNLVRKLANKLSKEQKSGEMHYSNVIKRVVKIKFMING